MIKRKIFYIIISISLMSFYMKDVFAYEYQDINNKNSVEDMITEVYDSKELYEELTGKKIEDEEILEEEASEDNYWWPIGSVETQTSNGKTFASDDPETIEITSPFGKRDDPFGKDEDGDGEVDKVLHSGIDISGGRGLGLVNIIAVRDGTVVYSSKGGEVCSSGSQTSDCGGGYGNYIIIQHTDGNYTLYGHLYENSLEVKTGDSVSQGQVIAKMGSSGNSTGAHLHFEVREGQNEYAATVDPLNYVDPNNPRPSSSDEDFVNWINAFEGSTGIASNGEYKIIDVEGYGLRSVGHGIVLEYNADRFAAHGINVANYPLGSTLPVSIVDAVELEELNSAADSIASKVSKNGLSFKKYQIQALISLQYNCGSAWVDDVIEGYKIYGETEALYNNTLGQCIHVGGEVWAGLVRRRKAEWHLFTTGEYTDGWEFM